MYLITRQQPHPFISQPHGPYHLAQKRGKHHHLPLPLPPSPPRIHTCDHHIYQKDKKKPHLLENIARVRACVRDPIILIGTKRTYMCLLHLSSKQYIRLVHTSHTYLLYIGNTTMATPNNFLFSSRNKKKRNHTMGCISYLLAYRHTRLHNFFVLPL